MPTFAGTNIFGIAVEMEAGVVNPRASQQNDYPGVSGLEELDQGLRGLFTIVTGTLIGSGASGLNAAESLFRSYFDGNAYVLVDQFGNSWPWVKLESFQAQGRIRQDPYGYMSRRYTARFRHLTV